MTQGRDDLTADEDEDFSVRPLLRTLWSYRYVMFTLLGSVFVVASGVLLAMYVSAPKERLATLGFRLTFEGAADGEFPNGTKFSTAEIVSTPVLMEVFKNNDLGRDTTFSDLKDAIFVLQANPDLDLLSYEYQAKLSDSKLSPVDRARIEEEFRKKRDSLKSAQFSINLRRTDRLRQIPASLLAKILQDTLSTWAQQAAERKGALRYDVPIPSNNALRKEFLTSEDYIVAADMLRATIERFLKAAADIAKIPGSSAVRLGPDQIALADVRARLEDLLRFKAEPLLGVIRTSGLSRSPVRGDQYFQDRAFEVRMQQQETSQSLKTLQEALRAYQQKWAPEIGAASTDGARGGGVTPQISESFIDRVVDLTTQSNDVKYRQALTDRIIDQGIVLADLTRQTDYYESLRRSFAGTHIGANLTLGADVARRTASLYDDISASAEQLQAIYKLVSQQNLNPNTVLYTITSPFVTTTLPSLTARTAVGYLMAIVLLTMFLVPVGCLAHSYFRHWISPSPSTGDGQPSDHRHGAGV